MDTVVFITLGFAIFPALGLGGDPTWGWALVSIVAGQYIVKLLVALIDTLPFYAVTKSWNDRLSRNVFCQILSWRQG